VVDGRAAAGEEGWADQISTQGRTFVPRVRRRWNGVSGSTDTPLTARQRFVPTVTSDLCPHNEKNRPELERLIVRRVLAGKGHGQPSMTSRHSRRSDSRKKTLARRQPASQLAGALNSDHLPATFEMPEEESDNAARPKSIQSHLWYISLNQTRTEAKQLLAEFKQVGVVISVFPVSGAGEPVLRVGTQSIRGRNRILRFLHNFADL
jgi:hypothetical protein